MRKRFINEHFNGIFLFEGSAQFTAEIKNVSL